MTTAASPAADRPIAGILHAFVAFDWGEALDLERAARLVPAETGAIARRRRTPSSIAYHPAPLRVALQPVTVPLAELGAVAGTTEATLFDIAAVSIALHLPFALPADRLLRLAAGLADPQPIVEAVRAAIEPFFRQLLPALRSPNWSPLCEEYFAFQLPPGEPLPPPERLLTDSADWLARLTRLEADELSREEVVESLRLRLTYTPRDLLVAEWAACVLVDSDCEETLQTIEFANVQLLEFRHIDRRLDERLEAAYQTIYPLARSWLPFWRTHARPLRALGALKVEANSMFERTGNVLKLVGDQYLARVYRLLATRFHLDQWENDIRRTLEAAQEVYQVVSDQAATSRTEVLELIVIALILLEIVLAVGRG